jgi:membrane associated rhomboid family serine protease
MFLHAGWLHLLGNMLFLHVFGRGVEDRLGRLRYLCLYGLGGAAAGATEALVDPRSPVPVIGASGAIAGVAGAYLLFFPASRVLTVVGEVPALVWLLLWLGWQVLSGLGIFGAPAGAGGVAFWAHVGGFVAGAILGPSLAGRSPGRGRRRRGRGRN